MIKILNYSDNDVVNVALPLITGEILGVKDGELCVRNTRCDSESIIWPIVGGKFKILVQLQNGVNELILAHKNSNLKLTLQYHPLEFKHFVRLIYIKCKGDDGSFQAPENENNSIESACNRLCLASQMLQTFVNNKFEDHDLSQKTFRLEEENGRPICHIFESTLSIEDAHEFTDLELWSYFAVELMNSNLRVADDSKFLAFLSCTKYENELNLIPVLHQEVLDLTKGYVAIGGGGLALFGTGTLHTWSEDLQQVPWRFGDQRKIDKAKLMDDSANRGFYWACYSTGLGATLHELGHTFDLGHTKDGIMGRGFDDIYKHFIIDMFYYDHVYQKEHNPHYQDSLSVIQSVSPSKPSSPSCKSDHDSSTGAKSPAQTVPATADASCDVETFGIPALSKYEEGSGEFNVHVRGAYWTRCSALILYYHKWFNNVNVKNSAITLNGTEIASPNGIRVIEFRDSFGTAFHHLEFLGSEKITSVNLKFYDILPHIPDTLKTLEFIAEDDLGNILKQSVSICTLLTEEVQKLKL